MKPSYITLVGTTPVITTLNNNNEHFNVSVRLAAGVTLEAALEDPAPVIAPTLSENQGSPGPTWLATPAAVNGIVNLTYPVRLLRFTPTTGGVCTILQQGLN